MNHHMITVVGDVPDPSGTTDVEHWREEGRREILRKIAKIDCIEYYGVDDNAMCFFCGKKWYGRDVDNRTWPEQHEDNCLYLAALRAIAPQDQEPTT